MCIKKLIHAYEFIIDKIHNTSFWQGCSKIADYSVDESINSSSDSARTWRYRGTGGILTCTGPSKIYTITPMVGLERSSCWTHQQATMQALSSSSALRLFSSQHPTMHAHLLLESCLQLVSEINCSHIASHAPHYFSVRWSQRASFCSWTHQHLQWWRYRLSIREPNTRWFLALSFWPYRSPRLEASSIQNPPLLGKWCIQ